MKFLRFLIIFAIQFLYTTSIEIDCNYLDNHYDVLRTIYICKVTGDLTITLKDQSTITSATQNHNFNKNNDDVLGFVGDNKYLKYFPQGLDKIFKNLKLFHIRYTYIQEIHQSDLKSFPELRELDLHDNEIQVLEDGLFKFNPKLVFVSFSSNKIVHIGMTVFDGLNDLEYLYLTSNQCISKGAYLSKSEVKDVVDYAKIECISPEFKEMEKELSELESEAPFLEDLMVKIQDFEEKLNSSKFSASSALKEKLIELKASKAQEIRFVQDEDLSHLAERTYTSNTFKIILILVIILSIALFGGILFLFIRRK